MNMKISELITLLEQCKEEYGDIRVASYVTEDATVEEFTEVARYWDAEDNAYLEIS